jgi:hypothetical protein
MLSNYDLHLIMKHDPICRSLINILEPLCIKNVNTNLSNKILLLLQNVFIEFLNLLGHISNTYCMVKYLVDLYQVSIKKKGKNIEANCTLQNSTCDDDDDTNPEDINIDITCLDMIGFFDHPEEKWLLFHLLYSKGALKIYA